MGNFRDLTGLRMENFTVLEIAGRDSYGKILWKCQCDCGNVFVTHGRSIVNKHCKSCGCLRNADRREKGEFRGLSDTRIYRIWKGMKERCFNPNCESYPDYGGRGITICEEWQGAQGFFNFLSWALNNGYSELLSIDRINNSGNYEPSNCRWATMVQQANNRRKPEKVRNQYGIWDYHNPEPPEKEAQKMEINNAISILKSMQGYQSEGFYKDAVSAGIAALEEKNEREGMWILYGGDSTQEFGCSKCRKLIKIPGSIYYSECPYKYCPNCGKRNLNPHEKPEGVKNG